MRVDSLFRAAGGPCSTDLVGVARLESRLFDGSGAPRIGRYIVREKVGRGGMGTVYAAFDPQLGRSVAVKVLHPELSSERLLREAKALARLRHPNILVVYEVGEAQQQAYIAMELIDGHTLGELQRSEALDWRRWLTYYLEAGRGLAAAHQARLVHRDFKPDNVLIDRDGRVVVADFGLAKHSEEPNARDEGAARPGADERLTAPGMQPGTTRYMAPEQFAGRACDARSDQYSFCLALWEAIHDEIPLSPSERGETAPWQALAVERRATPAWLRRVLLRGLHPSAGERWPAMEALLLALQRERVKRIRRVGGAAALFVMLVAAVYLLTVFSQRAADAVQARNSAEAARVHGIERAERRNDDAWLVLSAMQHKDPTIRLAFLAAVGDPEATPQWRNAAADALLRPVSLAILRGHTNELRGAAFSPNGRQVATASYDHTVRLWRVDGSGAPTVLRGHTDRVHTVVYSPDGRSLVSTSRDGTARLWDLERPTVVQVLADHEGSVYQPAFSSDGRMLATGDGGGVVRVWDLPTATGAVPREILRGHSRDVYYVEFSPDGRRLASASADATARIWTLSAAEPPRVLPGEGQVLRAHFSPDGATVVTASEWSGAHLWRARDGRHLIALRDEQHGVRDAVFSPDGERVVVVGASEVSAVWDARKGRRVRALDASVSSTAIAYSPEGRHIAIARHDGVIRLWSTRDERAPLELVGHRGLIYGLYFDPSGRYLLSSSHDRTARVWDVAAMRRTATELQPTGGWRQQGTCMGTGMVALAADRRIDVHALDAGGGVRSASVDQGFIATCRVSPDDGYLAAVTSDGDLYRWDLTGAADPRRSARDVSGLSFVDGPGIVVGHRNGDVSLLGPDGAVVGRARGHDQEVVAFSRPFVGRYVVSLGRDGGMIRWDLAGGLDGAQLAAPSGSRVSAGGDCPETGLLAVGNTRDPSVFLWDVLRGRSVGEISLDSGVPHDIVLDCRENVLVVAAGDGSLQVWSVGGQKLKERSELFLDGSGRLALDPSRSLLLVSHSIGGLAILKMPELTDVAVIQVPSVGVAVDRNGSVILVDHERGISHIELDSVIGPVHALQDELRRRTTACPSREQWRDLYLRDEWKALAAAADCEWRNGRSVL